MRSSAQVMLYALAKINSNTFSLNGFHLYNLIFHHAQIGKNPSFFRVDVEWC